MERLKRKTISVLKWLEKHTKTDIVYLAKGGFWTTFSQIILSGSTFILAIAFAHFISKETYGQYKYILSIVSLMSTLTLSAIGTGVLQSVSRGYEGTLQYAFWQNIKWSILFFLASTGLSIYYFTQHNTLLGVSFLLAGSIWPFFNSTNLYSSFLTAKKDFRRNAIYFDIIGNLLPYACLIVTMLVTKNPVWLVAVYFISNTLIGIILYRRVIQIYKPNNEIDPGMLNYSKHLSLMSILGGLTENLDQILVFHYIGAPQLAIYNYATALPDQIKGPLKNLANLMFPKFAERSDEEIKSGMNQKLKLLLGASVIIIFGYVFISPYFFKLFFPQYSSSIFYSQIFSLSLVSIIAIPANTYLSAKKKIKEQYIVNIVMSVIQIVLTLVSIIMWGIIGLVIARVGIRILAAIVSIILYKISINKTVGRVNA